MPTSTAPLMLPAGSQAELGAGSVLFIGTATTLIRYAGFCVLTDPNFLHRGERAALGYGLRSTRRTQPALSIDQLPPVDLIVLSHLHGDHFDSRAVRELDKRLPIVTTNHAARGLGRKGFAATHPLAVWDTQTVVKGSAFLRVTALPAMHAPQPLGALLPPVMGSMLEFGSGDEVTYRLYITGDTLLHKALREIPRRYPDIDLALVHLGGTKILGVLVTMDARQGIEALRITRPRTAVPIHYNDYTVFKSPLEDFQRAVAAQELDSGVAYLSHGETYEFTVSR
jgi:L-ascorbate metabolism protein UlaG (beta-lactamase superfamily)